MSKISEVIEIFPGMSNTVNLRNEFYDVEKNRKRMMGYKPIKSHRNIFLRIAKSFLPAETKVHLLVGHYGTGKSHLLLMLANYFSNTLAMPELKTFFQNFDQVDIEKSRSIQNLRSDKRYLVVTPDYASQEDFSETLLIALESAFKREEIVEDIDSIYSEALRQLTSWEEEESTGNAALAKYSKFIEILNDSSSHYNSIILLKKGLQNKERASLDLFKEIFLQMFGITFRYNATNIVDVLRDIVNSDQFKQRFAGIVFLYDEFDYTLMNRRISIQVVESFAELCKDSNDILFIGALHKELDSYADLFSIEHFRTVKQRFKTIDMKSEGLEEIVSAIVSVKKSDPLYIENVKPNLQQIYTKITDIQRLNLFDWLNPDEIKEKIINAVYPLHPLTMYCLLKMSTTVGSANRTLFTFLGGEGIDESNTYSYKSFINSTNILSEGGLLSLYTTDLLVDYFYKELSVDNTDLRETIKKNVRAYQSSLKELNNYLNQDDILQGMDNPIFMQIIKIMLVFDIVGIINDFTNISFGLNLQVRDNKVLKSLLKTLIQKKIIFQSPVSKVYEFRNDSVHDWEQSIDNEKENLIESGDYNLGYEFISIAKEAGIDRFLQAKKYQIVHNSDRRLLRVFEEVKNFGQNKQNALETIDYFKYYENELLSINSFKDSYDGIVIYVIAETEDDIKEARQTVKNNSSDYVIVVIPDEFIPIKESFLNLKSALLVKSSDDFSAAPMADQSRLESSYIGDINSGYFKQFIDNRSKYLNGRNSIWYGIEGKILESNPNNEQDPVYKFLDNLYNKFNILENEDINKTHKTLTGNKKFIFRDAINDLLEAGKFLSIDTSFGNAKGFIKYLKNVLFDKQLLKRTGKDGSILLCEIEKDTSKYEEVFPALVDMISYFKENKVISLPNLINKYRLAPFGLGEISLELFLSYVLKYFGDELIYKSDKNNPGEIDIQSFDQIEKIVLNPQPYSVFEKRELSDIQKDSLKSLYQIFSDIPLAVGDVPRINEVSTVMMTWFDGIPTVSKINDLYSDNETKLFLQLMKTLSHSIPYQFLFSQLQTVWHFEEDDLFTENIKSKISQNIKHLKKSIEDKLVEIEDTILKKYIEIFKVKGSTYTDLTNSISAWYNNLDDNQRDLTANWHTPQSKPLIAFLKNTQNIRNVIFKDIPGSPDYGLGKIKDWNVNNIKKYSEKIKNGLHVIEDHKIVVDLPILVVKKAELKELSKTKGVIFYDSKEDLDVLVKLPDNAKEIYISHDGLDPTSKNIQKQSIRSDTSIVPSKSDQFITMVAVSEDNNYSLVYSLRLKNNTTITEGDAFEWKMPIPNNKKQTKSIFLSLCNLLLEKNKISKSELNDILNNLTEEFK